MNGVKVSFGEKVSCGVVGDVRACTQVHRTQAHECASQTLQVGAGRSPVSYGEEKTRQGSQGTLMLCSVELSLKTPKFILASSRGLNYIHIVV